MTRTRKFYAFATPVAVAGLVFLIGVPSHADRDDEDGDYIDIDTGDDGNDGRNVGRLNIASQPWADVYIDGQHIGTTPIGAYEVAPGRHKVTFVNKDEGVKESTIIVVSPGANVNLTRTFGGPSGDDDDAARDAARAAAQADAAAARAAAQQAKGAAKQAKAAVKAARAQLEAAKREIAKNPHLSADMRELIQQRLEKALETVEQNLGNLSFNGDWDAFEQQMEAFGDQMDDAFDGMDDDFDQMGKDISKQVRKALKNRFKHGIHIDVDGDGQDDDVMMITPPTPPTPPAFPTPPTPPTPPVPPIPPDYAGPNGGVAVIDLSDMNLAVDLDALGLTTSQKEALRQVMEDEQRVVQPMEEQLEQLSDKLREALDDVDVDEQDIDRFVDQISEREAAIRKARLRAWAKARKVLDDDQRQQVMRAGQGRHRHGP